MPSWLLPENIADVLPADAGKIEDLRRSILDRFRLYGYELVMPPMLEYIESLLTGTGRELDLRTFKLVDQLSGRTLGVRADMTTQVARIDAHLLNRSSITRLCYAGTALHAQPLGLHASREPFQIGAEIYGHPGLEADAEIQELALASLQAAGIDRARLDLSHVAVLRSIIESDALAREDEPALFALLESKDVPGLEYQTRDYDKETRAALLALPQLYGDVSIIEIARSELPSHPAIEQALNELKFLAGMAGDADITIDLADMRGYHYHSGVMFAAYVPGHPNALLRGGRYDHVGEVFGRARPATGFSMDLRVLAQLTARNIKRGAISADWGNTPALRKKIAELRAEGEIVVQGSREVSNAGELGCDRVLVCEDGNWTLQKLS